MQNLDSGSWSQRKSPKISQPWLLCLAIIVGKKLFFGLSCSSDLFNAKLQELYQGVDNWVDTADHTMMYGFKEDESDYD